MDFNSFKNKFEKVPIIENNNNVFKKPLVSVCIQTYQHVDFISECLDSILKQQTNFPFEILLGEDESTDGTKLICEDYANKFPEKIRFFSHKRENNILINGNPSGRFNMLYNLLSSNGKFIAICEGDDYWTDPLKLQKQVDFLEANTEYGICFHRANLKKEDTFKLHEVPDFNTNGVYEYIDLLKNYNFITTASVVFRKPENFSIPDWFKNLPFGDLGLYKLILNGKKIKCLEDVMSVYRLHSNGMWSKLKKTNEDDLYLKFYRVIFPVLSIEEQIVVNSKISTILKRNKKEKDSSKIRYKLINSFKKIISQLWK